MANAIVLRSFSLIGMAYAQLNSARYVGGKSTLTRTGKAAKLPFPVHPHMLRHSTGYKLANDGHDTRSLAHYLGHRNLQSTARYTALAPHRFARFWQD